MIKDFSLKILKVISSVFLILGAIYLVGPRVETPKFSNEVPEVPDNLVKLQKWINTKEILQGNVRPGNASKIIFNDLRHLELKEILFIVILLMRLEQICIYQDFLDTASRKKNLCLTLIIMIFGSQENRP